MPGFLGEYNTSSAVPEMYCCQEPTIREEPVCSLEQFPASAEYAATLNRPHAKKRRRQVSPLMFFSSALIAVVATVSIGYLSIDAALTYVSENAAEVFVSALQVTSEGDAVPLTYELVERDTSDIVAAGLVSPGDAVMSFGNLANSTEYALRIYSGQELVKQLPFSTVAGKSTTKPAMPTPVGQATTKPAAPTPSPAAAPTFVAADGTVLTAAEAANAGTHSYQSTWVYYGTTTGDTSWMANQTLKFVTVNGKKMMGDETQINYNMIAENTYTATISGQTITITFDLAGFKGHAEGAFDYDYRLKQSTAPSPSPAPTPAPTFVAEDGTLLTAAEAANVGTHTYQYTALFYGTTSGDPSGTQTETLKFETVNGVKMLGDGEQNYYSRVAENTYSETISGLAITITFDLGGFKGHADGTFDYDYRLAQSTAPPPAPAPKPTPTFVAADGTPLTAAEAANAGTHTYYTTGEIYGPSGGRLEPSTQSLTLMFVTVGGKQMFGDGETPTYTRVAENLYEGSINGIKLTATFTVTGFKINAEGAYDVAGTLMP